MKKAELTSAIAQSLESAIVIFTDVCYFAGEGQFSDSLVRFQANTQEPKLGLTKEMLQCCVTAWVIIGIHKGCLDMFIRPT